MATNSRAGPPVAVRIQRTSPTANGWRIIVILAVCGRELIQQASNMLANGFARRGQIRTG